MAEPTAVAHESAPDPNWPSDVESRLTRIGDAELDVVVVLGHARMTIEELLSLEPGDLIETRTVSGVPLDVLVNGRLFCRGEAVVIGDQLAIRINDLPNPS